MVLGFSSNPPLLTDEAHQIYQIINYLESSLDGVMASS